VETAERIDEFDQIVIEKVHLDCFTNPNLEWLLEALGAERYLVYGVVTEVCVRFAAFGLLERGQTVEIVTDAVKAFNEAKARAVLDEFVAGGGRLTTCQDVLSRA
jgi:nicotinamidase/pyrazinamidase